MLKIGFIDYYLDEWHANQYPGWISRLSEGRAGVCAAYGYMDSPKGGLTTAEWCARNGILCCTTPEGLIAACDCIVVLSPDNSEMHWLLCQEALRSGKRTFVDKTFAPNEEIARALFALAEAHQTPMYSTSALRFAAELDALPWEEAEYIDTCGPGLPDSYLIHQFEPIIAVMRKPLRRVSYLGTQQSHHFDLEFSGEARASVSLLGEGPFHMTVKYRSGKVCSIPDMSGYFDRFLSAMIHFFETGEGAVPKEQTIAIAAAIEAAHQAMKSTLSWIEMAATEISI